jgi:phage terminase small subunit
LTDDLTPKQAAFVREYLVDHNASAAALRAGYAPKAAYKTGWENLQKPHIMAEISKTITRQAKKVEVSVEYVLSTIVSTINRCSQEEPVRDKNGDPTGEYKFDAANVLKGTEQLGKHLEMFTDKRINQHNTTINVVEQLQAARDRLARVGPTLKIPDPVGAEE